MSLKLLVTYNEIWKGFRLAWQYKFDTLVPMVYLCLIFVAISFFMGGGEIVPDVVRFIFIGFVTWYLSALVIRNSGSSLAGETQAGTLEHMYMSPVSTEFILLGRLISSLLTSFIVVGCFALVMLCVMEIRYSINWALLPVLALTVTGVMGFGLAVGGFTLVFKQTTGIAGVVQNALMFLNGTFFSVDEFPVWLELFARSLPTTYGIEVSRNVMIDDMTFAAIFADGSLYKLALHSVIYLGIGWLLYKWCERRAKVAGSLGQY